MPAGDSEMHRSWLAASRMLPALSALPCIPVRSSLVTHLGDRPVTRIDNSFIRQREELLVNAVGKCFEAAAGHVRSADTAAEQHIAAENNPRAANDKHDMAWRMAGDLANIQRQPGE